MRHIRAHALDYFLLLAWAFFIVIQFISNKAEFTAEQLQHGQMFQWAEFMPYFWGRFAENHGSEMAQLGIAARAGYLAGKYYARGWMTKSPDGDQAAQLDRIEARMKAIDERLT